MAKTPKPAPMTPPMTAPMKGGNVKKGGMKGAGGKKCRMTCAALAIACLAALAGCGYTGANAGVTTPPVPSFAAAPSQTYAEPATITVASQAPIRAKTYVALPSQTREK